MAKHGYNLVVAKGVSTGNPDLDFKAAWISKSPSELSPHPEISWAVVYNVNWTSSEPVDGGRLSNAGDSLDFVAGTTYTVDSTGTLIVDPNAPLVKGVSWVKVNNNNGYSLDVYPLLTTVDGTGPEKPFWADTTGLPRNFGIIATPVEVVRVWLGKYLEGTAVLAAYSGPVVQFVLSTIRDGRASLASDLSGWSGLSGNATVITPNLLTFSKGIPFSGNTQAVVGKPDDVEPTDLQIMVMVTFNMLLTAATVTYLATRLTQNLTGTRPRLVEVKLTGIRIIYSDPRLPAGPENETVRTRDVNQALTTCQKDPKSDMAGLTWRIVEDKLVLYT